MAGVALLASLSLWKVAVPLHISHAVGIAVIAYASGVADGLYPLLGSVEKVLVGN